MRTFIGEVPLSVLALAVSVVIAIALSRPVAGWLHTRRYVAALTLIGFGFVLSATLVPTGAALEGAVGDGMCDTSRVGFASIEELTSVNVSSLNVLLFVPLGFAVGLLPLSRAAAVTAVAAASLTFVVETIQLWVPVLGRGCQTADMVDNLMGLVIGLVIGLLARPMLPRS
jgi:glycopeptide antibiotics resistance protein